MSDLKICLGSRQYGKTYKQRKQIKSYIKLNYIPRKRIENEIEDLEDLLDLCKIYGHIAKYKIFGLEKQIEILKEILRREEE